MSTDLHASVTARLRERPVAALAVSTALAILVGGCADRGLVARPSSHPGAGTWLAVWVAAAMVAAVIGLLVTLPAWQTPAGSRLATVMLTAQAGAAAVGGVVLASVALRTWQLIGRRAADAPATDLLRLSRVDGDARYYALMLTVVTVLTVLVVALTAAAARLAASDDPFERTVASALLAIETGGSAYAVVRLVLGANGLPYLLPSLALPLLVASFVACWPRLPGGARA